MPTKQQGRRPQGRLVCKAKRKTQIIETIFDTASHLLQLRRRGRPGHLHTPYATASDGDPPLRVAPTTQQHRINMTRSTCSYMYMHVVDQLLRSEILYERHCWLLVSDAAFLSQNRSVGAAERKRKMGKKSRKLKPSNSGGATVAGGGGGNNGKKGARCCVPSCKRYLKHPTKQGVDCPGCDKLFCESCATFGSRKGVGFVSCGVEGCPHPPRCADCAYGKTFQEVSKENKALRESGKPTIPMREGYLDQPFSICGNSESFDMQCFACMVSPGKVPGHQTCFECGKNRCFSCSTEQNCGDHDDFIMFCFGCERVKCIECDPDKTIDLPGGGNWYCSKCSADPKITRWKKLMLAKTFNKYCNENADTKVVDL